MAPPKKSRPVGYGVIGVVVRTEGGIAKQNGMIPKCIGGVSYHVPFRCNPAYEIDRCEGRSIGKGRIIGWIHQTFPNLRNFAWQQGYGAFSVGISQVQATIGVVPFSFRAAVATKLTQAKAHARQLS